ncbi:MAG: hypothetical protein Q9195_000580 [Heterodermia aff. obscurata]
MIDPVTAIGLATNVVQFVDFSWGLLCDSKRLYDSGTGLSAENEDLEMISNDLLRLYCALTAPSSVGAIPDQMGNLAFQCKSVAEELLTALNKVKEKGPRKRWTSFVVTLQSVWKKGQIEGLMEVKMILGNLVTENKKLHIHGMHSLQWQLENVQHMVLKLQSDSKLRDAAIQAFCEAPRQSSSVKVPTMSACAESMSNLTRQLSSLSLKVGSTASDQMLLRSLHFKAIKSRESQIVPANTKTLTWLLDPCSGSNLSNWLESQRGIYWINGKAGSGKSTLMKYLVAHPQTTKLLKTWAGNRTLVTASVYFWHAGTALQKSQEGLFRTLLFEILSQSPDLIRLVCASKLAAFRRFEEEIEPWTDLELREAIDLLKGETEMKARFCFFIDGLDEYNGHPEDIIKALQSLGSIPNIKLCVSSRPWNEFIDSFGGFPGFRLHLEELTRGDITTHVKQTLETNDHFVIPNQNDPRSQDLVQEIVDKARGVFLWVVLVTRSLLDGLRNADRICDLQRRLRQLPETLEKYFSHMYYSIEKIYREQTAQTFQFVLAATKGMDSSRLSLTLFSFLDEEDLDAAGVNSLSKPLKEPDISSRQDIMRRRLLARCMGLVEIVNEDVLFSELRDSYSMNLVNPVVDFIHRTAYDFLATKDMQIQLSENLKPDFEAHTLIFKAYLAVLKRIDYHRGKVERELVYRLIESLVRHVGHFETISSVVPITVLDETRLAAIKYEKYADDFHAEPLDLFFLRATVLHGSHYIPEILNRKSHQISHDTMSKIICVIVVWPNTMTVNLDAVNPLIEHGGGPSLAWDQIVLILYKRQITKPNNRTSINDELLEATIEKLLQYGADLQYCVVDKEATSEMTSEDADPPQDSSTGNRSPSAQELITEHFGEDKARKILSTRQLDNLVSKILP